MNHFSLVQFCVYSCTGTKTKVVLYFLLCHQNDAFFALLEKCDYVMISVRLASWLADYSYVAETYVL